LMVLVSTPIVSIAHSTIPILSSGVSTYHHFKPHCTLSF
jgi:hypothetical protein